MSPSCPPFYLPSSLNPFIRKFLYFPGAQRVVTGFATGREQRHSPLSHWINTTMICLSPFSLSILSVYFFHPPAWLNWSDMSGRVECQRGDDDEWDSTRCCYLVLFSSLTVFVSAGSGRGHRPYHDGPAKQCTHWRSKSWYALCGTGPCPNSGWLRPLQQPGWLQHQPAKYVILIPTLSPGDILGYLWLSSNTFIIVLCIILWT